MITIAFYLTILSGFSTLIGFLFIFIKNKDNKIIINASLSFASGVMLYVSFFDLIKEGFNFLKNDFSAIFNILLCFLFFIIGYIISFLINRFLPENNSKLYKVGLVNLIAIILHNIPEGIITFLTSTINIKIGISLALAIAMHNIPEGISIAIPIYYATNNKKKALYYTLISACAEPLGAIIAYLFLKPILNNFILASFLLIAAGIMTQISFSELLPTALSYNKKRKTLFFFLLGCIIMFLSNKLF